MTFRQAAVKRWRTLYDDAEYGPCEGGCGERWISKDTVPHHIGEAKGGIGGKRTHDPKLLRFLCDRCHRSEHA